VVLATKVFGGMSKEDWPNFDRLSALNIVRAAEGSLKRLQTDRIDLYQMHHVDRETPWEEIWQAMELLVQQGKVTYVGSSNFAGWHIAQANEAARRRNFLGLASEQCFYNLADRMVELEILPAAQAYGMGVIPWSPLGRGILGGALHKASKGRRSSGEARRRIEEHRDQLEAYEKLCADLGEEPANVALAWLLAQPAVTAPIVGPRTMEQLDGAVRAHGDPAGEGHPAKARRHLAGTGRTGARSLRLVAPWAPSGRPPEQASKPERGPLPAARPSWRR